VHGRLRANNADAVYRAVLDGRGIALMPHLLVTDDIRTGRLRHLLPEFPSRRFPLYVIYPSKRGRPPRTRAVIEYLTELLDKDPDMALGGVARRTR
jgi:DNA-binding transcriptional LysR family regulator